MHPCWNINLKTNYWAQTFESECSFSYIILYNSDRLVTYITFLMYKYFAVSSCFSCALKCGSDTVLSISSHFLYLQWQAISLTVIEKVQIAAAVLGSLFLMASISWLVWSSLSPSAKWQRQDLLFQICYAMYGFMDLVCIGRSLDSQ